AHYVHEFASQWVIADLTLKNEAKVNRAKRVSVVEAAFRSRFSHACKSFDRWQRTLRDRDGSNRWVTHQCYPARQAAAPPAGPSGLGGIQGALWSKDFRLVREVELATGRCRGRDADGTAEAGREDADVCIRPVAELSRLAKDRHPPCLERFLGHKRAGHGGRGHPGGPNPAWG